VLPCGDVPLDVGTFAMDHSGTAKALVGRTYAGVDSDCLLAASLGTQGFCLELALRAGTQHSVSESEDNIERVLPLAARVCDAPLLVRAACLPMRVSGYWIWGPRAAHRPSSRSTSTNSTRPEPSSTNTSPREHHDTGP